MAKFGNDIIAIQPTGGTAFNLQGITDTSGVRNSQVNQANTGLPYGAEATIGFQAPTIPISTEDLETVITEISNLNGVCYSTGVGPGLKVYQLRRNRCHIHGRDSGSTHMSITSQIGHILVESVSASGAGSVQISMTAHALSATGESDPFVMVFNEAPSSYTINEDAWKMAGPVLNGVYLPGLESATINYNHQTEKPIDSEVTYAKDFDWQKCNPTISLTFNDPEFIHSTVLAGALSLGPLGMRLTSGSSYLQFRAKATSGGGWDAAANATHIRCGINGIVHAVTPWSASGSGSSRVTLEIVTNESTVGVPLVWLTGQLLVTS